MRALGPSLEKLFRDVEPVPFEHGRYRVRSRSGGRARLVDVLENCGYGQCDCEHFQFKCAPEIKKGIPVDGRFKCFHVKRADEYWNLWTKQQMIRHREKLARPAVAQPPQEDVRRAEPARRPVEDTHGRSRRLYVLDNRKYEV